MTLVDLRERAENGLTADPAAADRVSVADVTRELRRRIASHAIPPGARLREWDIAEEFGIPRLSAREALDGWCISALSIASRTAASSCGDANWWKSCACSTCARSTKGSARGSRPRRWHPIAGRIWSNNSLHRWRKSSSARICMLTLKITRCCGRLIDAAASPPLADLLHRLYDLTDIHVRRVILVSDRAHHGLLDHRAVLAALRAGDAAEAERLRRLTVANIRAAVEQLWRFLL